MAGKDKPIAKQRGNIGNLRPFPKGVSGNPKGRPKSKTLTEVLRERLAMLAADVPWAAEYLKTLDIEWPATIGDVFVSSTVLAALRGDRAACAEIWERIDGKVSQPTEIGGGDKAVRIEVTYRDRPKRGNDSD